MKKYIHYCWFGDKPFPKLAQKCLESWQKYLPDFEIMKWSEENLDLEECPFVKGAYENKKWAFVADYARAKALKEYGGIYFDTDMEVLKPIDYLFDHETFLGIEESGYVAVGVWYEQNTNAFLPTKLLEIYRKFESFDVDNMTSLSIPILISEILKPLDLQYGLNKAQVLDHDIAIYPRDYFYPYSYNRDNNLFTDNTCMIHYYDASWLPLKSRVESQLVRSLGKKWAYRIINCYRRLHLLMIKIAKVVLFPYVIYRRYKRSQENITDSYLDRLSNTISSISQVQGDYITIYNSYWYGVTSATKELFSNLVDCGEIYRKKDCVAIGNAILNSGVKQVVFSAFADGWKDLIIYIKKKDASIKIKTFWHGNHSQVLDTYGWNRNLEIIDLHQKKYVDVMGTCKKSLIEFYQNQGYTSKFITNKVNTKTFVSKKKKRKDDKIRIGLYAAKCDDWRKNMYSQMAAVSLIPNAEIDMVPLNDAAKSFAERFHIQLVGVEKSLPREQLLERMSQNDVTMYVTFSECAPMLPLESFEVGVPCILGNNQHYFVSDKLENEIIVKNEDDVLEIKEKVENCIKNKDKILKMYESFKKKNNENAKKDVEDFLRM